jgi:hypothetical protein
MKRVDIWLYDQHDLCSIRLSVLDKRNGKLSEEGRKKRKRFIKKLISLGSGSKDGT